MGYFKVYSRSRHENRDANFFKQYFSNKTFIRSYFAMLRRSQRVVYLTIIFLLLVTSLQTFFRSESFIKKFLKQKIGLKDIKILVDNPLHLLNADFYNRVDDYELKDWHDYEFIAYEANRVGPGENGSAVELTYENEINTNQMLFEIEGLHVVVSDKISVNRSLPDVRHEKLVFVRNIFSNVLSYLFF